MGKYRLGVCDADTAYVEALMNYMNTHRNIPYTVIAFSSSRDIGIYLENSTLDILLLGENEEKCENKIPTLILSETIKEDEAFLYKYQSVKEISNRLNGIVNKLSANKTLIGRNEFVAVFCLETGRISEDFLRGLFAEDRKNIIIYLDEFRSIIDSTDAEDMFIFYMLSHNEELINVIRKMTEAIEISESIEINGPLSYMDIRELRVRDVMWFRDLIKREKGYKYIFRIEGGVLSDLDILNIFDCVYVPYFMGAESARRIGTFKKIIGFENGEERKQNIRFVRMEEQEFDCGEKWPEG